MSTSVFVVSFEEFSIRMMSKIRVSSSLSEFSISVCSEADTQLVNSLSLSVAVEESNTWSLILGTWIDLCVVGLCDCSFGTKDEVAVDVLLKNRVGSCCDGTDAKVDTLWVGYTSRRALGGMFVFFVVGFNEGSRVEVIAMGSFSVITPSSLGSSALVYKYGLLIGEELGTRE